MSGMINLIQRELPGLARRSSAENGWHTVLSEFGDPIPHPGCLDRRDGDPIRR